MINVSIDSNDLRLQINKANSIHPSIPQPVISSVSLAVGIPRWNGKATDAISLRIGWSDADHLDLANTDNTQEEHLRPPVTMASVAGSSFRLSIEASADHGCWPLDAGSFRLKKVSVDGPPYVLEDWAYWIEESATWPGPGDQKGAPPACIAFPGDGPDCNVCAAGVEGVAGICPLVRKATGFAYQHYMWRRRSYWGRESPLQPDAGAIARPSYM